MGNRIGNIAWWRYLIIRFVLRWGSHKDLLTCVQDVGHVDDQFDRSGEFVRLPVALDKAHFDLFVVDFLDLEGGVQPQKCVPSTRAEVVVQFVRRPGVYRELGVECLIASVDPRTRPTARAGVRGNEEWVRSAAVVDFDFDPVVVVFDRTQWSLIVPRIDTSSSSES